MNDYKLYEIAVIEYQEKKKDESTKPPRIVLEPRTLMARSDQDAAVKGALKFKEEIGDANPERIDILVRPF